ncbi:MAG: hypothetical protein KC493_02835, partial [Bacteriovoracaceae bacterium]|nr:hypothetical protein [Bacteriovoracaceae bacterium]
NPERFENLKIINPKKWGSFSVEGVDALSFLQGQTTSDLSKLHDGEARLNARVDRNGKTQALFFVGKTNTSWMVFIELDFLAPLMEELEKFIIMEDVVLNKTDNDVTFYTYPTSKKPNLKDYFTTTICGVPGLISLQKPNTEFESLDFASALLLGFPYSEISWNKGELLTNSHHCHEAVSLDKGCFLGQETVAKVLTNRGASINNAIVEIDTDIVTPDEGDSFAIEGKNAGQFVKSLDEKNWLIQVKRAYSIKNKKVIMVCKEKEIEVTPCFLPKYEEANRHKLSEESYEYAMSLFTKDEKSAEEYFLKSLDIDPSNQAACEAYGVYLGRMGKYSEGIQFMDKLLELDTTSVMAHTNKSLFLMKLGKIEEAEEEKSLATVATFKKLGDESKKKRETEQVERQALQDLEKKKEMFLQVLEIDADDLIANFGLAEYNFKTKNFEKAVTLMEKVIGLDEGYSRAYLILGKSLIELKEKEKASNVFSIGIEKASQKGELMPANEMQQLLISIQ